MQKVLTEKLRAYLVNNNPDLLLKLQGDTSITKFIEDKVSMVMPMVLQLLEEGKPGYVIEELCLNTLTEDLRPSKFNYLQEILEVEFKDQYQKFKEAGVLTYETVNLVEACASIFETYEFNENTEDNRFLRYMIIAEVHDYLLR
ncbi:DUF1896 family protein [Pedobacter sp. ASV28]|uniref:DUF1896 family protein n=1 Tax=Pedobacter sp. ASV28 TaxID=2795123 RepID=UPI0018EA8C3C|nr:DUF1896 family protein [Pedobacter sp. ASV28]